MPSLGDILGKLGETWPARMAKSAYGAATLPGDVYAGRTDPTSDEAIGRAADLAGMIMGGTFSGAPAGAVGAGPVRKSLGTQQEYYRSGHYRRPIEGTKEGFLEYTLGDQLSASSPRLELRLPYMEEEARGAGKGIAAFQQLVDQALSEGKTVFSESNNQNAVNLYKALERRGYGVHFGDIENTPTGDIVRGSIEVTGRR